MLNLAWPWNVFWSQSVYVLLWVNEGGSKYTQNNFHCTNTMWMAWWANISLRGLGETVSKPSQSIGQTNWNYHLGRVRSQWPLSRFFPTASLMKQHRVLGNHKTCGETMWAGSVQSSQVHFGLWHQTAVWNYMYSLFSLLNRLRAMRGCSIFWF